MNFLSRLITILLLPLAWLCGGQPCYIIATDFSGKESSLPFDTILLPSHVALDSPQAEEMVNKQCEVWFTQFPVLKFIRLERISYWEYAKNIYNNA